jgi:hypothetical protein
MFLRVRRGWDSYFFSRYVNAKYNIGLDRILSGYCS